MFRIIEILTRWVPQIFVDKDQIHSTRFINYTMFVLNSIFMGGIDSYLDFFS